MMHANEGSAVLNAPRATVSPVEARTVSTRHPGDEALSGALKAWRAALGEDAVFAKREAQERHGANTMGLQREIPAAVAPKTAAEVAQVVRIAARFRVPLYPISTGRNWGYGSANPVRDGGVIVDCSKMDRIVALDEELGLVTVQPGVTQGMLAEYLDARGLDFMVPVTGAGPRASLLGNAMERGYGITPHADHFAAVTALEAVLPDGTLYRSGLHDAGGEEVNGAFKWGVGPYMDGLFTQGNFGIVTQVTIALARRPERVEAFFCSFRCDADLERGVEAVRTVLRELGGLSGSINLMNARRMLSMVEAFPREQVGDGEIIPDALVEKLAKVHRITAWTAAGALYGPAPVVKAAKKRLKRILKPLAKRIAFFTPKSARLASKIANALPVLRTSPIANALRRIDAAMQVMDGRPSDIALPLSYWKTRAKPRAEGAEMDPARDGCGLLWYAPLVPMKADRVRAYAEMVERVCRAHGIEPLITLTSLNERCFDSTVPILFDRANPNECARAQACFEALFEAGRAQGFLPYRLSVSAMRKMVDPESAFWRLGSALKKAVDPENLIAPGRYAL